MKFKITKVKYVAIASWNEQNKSISTEKDSIEEIKNWVYLMNKTHGENTYKAYKKTVITEFEPLEEIFDT